MASGALRSLSIEIAAGSAGVSGSRIDEVLRTYLDDQDPPRRVILDREGNIIRTVSRDH
jgi:hypothetical protein